MTGTATAALAKARAETQTRTIRYSLWVPDRMPVAVARDRWRHAVTEFGLSPAGTPRIDRAGHGARYVTGECTPDR